jgi:hypothetical protein
MYLQLGRPAIRGNFLVDITVRAAQDALGNHYQGRREEIVSFFGSGRVNAKPYLCFGVMLEKDPPLTRENCRVIHRRQEDKPCATNRLPIGFR